MIAQESVYIVSKSEKNNVHSFLSISGVTAGGARTI